ncbi:MAG TPA: sensor histidine kinase [Firmicutes bacterium]|nr:sensor histidine kinase [Bacillota bacterium]
MDFFRYYIKGRRGMIGVFFLFVLVFAVVFWLYGLPVQAVLYPAAICGALGVLFLISDIRRERSKHRRLCELEALPAPLMSGFPEWESPAEEDYRRIIERLREEMADLGNQMNRRYEEMIDYYTAWVHQIKTPIASMRLTFQNEDSALSRKAAGDLFRIEQYVEMVLVFLRLDSESTDYVFREYDVDGMIRQAVRRFSSQFIDKKLRLVYEPVRLSVITDEKWLLFVLEQVLSNAVKYTPSGGCVTIDLEAPATLCVRDTGIGIAPEDLPRIFEKGYTGRNGRSDKRASGLGLYLCRRICGQLGHRITANSSPDSGTVIRIRLDQKKLDVE